MRTTSLLDGVPIFLTVAEMRSFTAAAKRLGISPSAASQAVRSLEGRLGVTLLTRSTRTLSLTAAGTAYVERAGPALAAIADATHAAQNIAGRVAGPLRLTMPRAAYDGVVAPMLRTFRTAYPAVELEIEIEGGLVDIVERGFQAGLRYGHLVAKGMTSLPVFPSTTSVLTASPDYLAGRPAPQVPGDLERYETIVCRSRTTGLVAPWILTAGNEMERIAQQSSIVTGDLSTQIDLTIRGFGISCTPIQCIADPVQQGKLVRVLPDWSSPIEAIHLYYPDARGLSRPLQAFIDSLVPSIDVPNSLSQ